jgi:hypothetical protein
MPTLRKLTAIYAAIFYVTAARADVRWTADFANDDLKQYGAIHCGGQGGSCPCIAPLWQPSNQVSYGSGSCSTSSSNTPLSLAPAGGRFQIVTPPGQETAGKALRVELRGGDFWPCSTCSGATTRNEVVYTRDSGTSTPTYYQAGDDRYFAWSTYFPPEFASWTCKSSDANCPGGVPNSSFNPWNVVTQLHHNSDGGVNPIGIDLRRTTTSSANSYALVFLYGYNDGSSDSELWRQDLNPGNWYDFVLHVRFSQASDGILELWVGNNGGPKTKQTLWCPAGASATCNVATLYADGQAYLKQGLYRNASIADTSVIFHKGMTDGDTFVDVAPPPPNVTPKVSSLVDSFGGTAIDTSRWTVTAINGSATESGGTLNLRPAAYNGSVGLTVGSAAQYDFTASSATVQVPQAVSMRCGVNNRFLLKRDGANSLGFWAECGNLYAFTFVDGAERLLATLTYSASAQQWWRVRESNGTVTWETSPDKVNWTTAASAPTASLFPVDSLTVTFDSYTWGGGLRSPGTAKYAHLNQ